MRIKKVIKKKAENTIIKIKHEMERIDEDKSYFFKRII